MARSPHLANVNEKEYREQLLKDPEMVEIANGLNMPLETLVSRMVHFEFGDEKATAAAVKDAIQAGGFDAKTSNAVVLAPNAKEPSENVEGKPELLKDVQAHRFNRG